MAGSIEARVAALETQSVLFAAASTKINEIEDKITEIVAEHVSMKADIAALKQFVGMMPPPSVPPSPLHTLRLNWT